MTRVRHLAGAVALALAATTCALAQTTGPSSSQSPYIQPTAPGWQVTSLLSVGDYAQSGVYRMVGIPDGLGALAGRYEGTTGRYVGDRRYMTVFMNHELGATAGAVRAHNAKGAFVSQWTIHLDSLRVVAGEDLVRSVKTWSNGAYVDSTGVPDGVFGRFCSADLPAYTAFYNPETRRGFNGRILLNGEEAGAEGRAFAHVLTGPQKGTAWQLPYLGRFSWENAVAHPNAGDRTIVMGLDDSTPGQVYVYVGQKQRTGANPVELAGLTGGKLYGIKVANGGTNYAGGPARLESNGAIEGRFTLADVSDVATGSGAVLQTTSIARDVTEFARPEDGAWDTKNRNVFYFVTTGATVGGKAQTARLYKLTFDDVLDPARGGRIDLVVDAATLTGTDGQTARSFDNITVDGDGQVVVQEDPGNNPYTAKVWRVDPNGRSATQIYGSDPARFGNNLTGAAARTPTFPFNADEENSGVIEVTALVKGADWYQKGRRYYLGVMQAHYAIEGELVEGGQLYLMTSARAGQHAAHDDEDEDDRAERRHGPRRYDD